MRPSLALGAFIAALLAAGCTVNLPGASPSPPTTVDRECQVGMPFVTSYTAVANLYDPQLEAARLVLATPQSLDGSHATLRRLATLLAAYDDAINGLKTPPEYSLALKAVVDANTMMEKEALALADNTGPTTDQAAFTAAVDARHKAVRDLQLQLDFVTAECG